MRFLVDECVGPSVVRWLRENNHDATSVYEDCRGWEDESILKRRTLTLLYLKADNMGLKGRLS